MSIVRMSFCSNCWLRHANKVIASPHHERLHDVAQQVCTPQRVAWQPDRAPTVVLHSRQAAEAVAAVIIIATFAGLVAEPASSLVVQ